jgi:hypothetical protein
MTIMQRPVDTPELENLKMINYGSEFDLADAAVAFARTLMPEWQPRQGNTEMVLIQSLALQLGPETLAMNIMPFRMLEQLMLLYGVRRDPGLPATGRIKLTVSPSAATQIIPAGSIFRLPPGDSGLTVDLVTNDALSIITTETLEGYVNVTANRVGSDPNNTPVGTILQPVTNLPFVELVEIDEEMTGGMDVENDAQFYGRAASVLGRLTSTLVLPEHFTFAALSRTEVGRAKTFNLYNPIDPEVTAAGHITVAVADSVGQPLDGAEMEAIRADLASQALASLTIHVIPPTLTTVNFGITVKPIPGYTEAAVRANVIATLQYWLSPANWDWDSSVRKYAIIATASRAAGVAEVTFAPDDIPLSGKAPLAQAGTITVTVMS